MQVPNEQPERLVRPTAAPMSSGGGLQMSGGIRQIIIMAIISVIVSFGLAVAWILPQTESAANFKANIGPIITDITTLKNTQKGDEGTIATLSTQITGLSKQVSDLQASLNTLGATVANHTNLINGAPTRAQLDALQTQITTLNSKVAALPDSATLKADYTAQIATVQASLNTVSQKVTELATSLNGTGGGTGGTATPAGQVTATVLGNAFTGSQILSYLNGVPATLASSQSFSFQLTNNTGKSITNIQLAIGLEVLDANNNVLQAGLPTTTTVTLSSSGTAVVWGQQTTGIPYILGFANTVPTGIFGGLGVLSQSTVNGTYNLTVTVTSGANATPAFQLFPIVKVVSFS